MLRRVIGWFLPQRRLVRRGSTFRALCGLFQLVGLGRCPSRFLFGGLAVGDLLLIFRDEAVGGFQRIHLDALLAQAIGGARLQVV